MSNNDKLGDMKAKLKQKQKDFERKLRDEVYGSVAWHSVSKTVDKNNNFDENEFEFVGKNLENGKFAGEDLRGVNFSVANLTNVDFSNANLQGVDFSGANLTGANLSGADLSGAILSGTVLNGTNFTKAKLNGVKLVDADLENAILLDIEIDEIGIEDLQELIEYLAKYYPHKLNLRNINLTFLNLARIDLSKVDLRGVDFSGVDFTGVNIVGLDLSECNITPQQIAQALGRMPGAEELAKILAPKTKKASSMKSIDVTELFFGDGREFGVLDFQKDKGVSVEALLKAGKKVFGGGKKPEPKNSEVVEDKATESDLKAKTHNEELRKVIEERKQKELAARQAQKEKNHNKKRMIPLRDAGRGR